MASAHNTAGSFIIMWILDKHWILGGIQCVRGFIMVSNHHLTFYVADCPGLQNVCTYGSEFTHRSILLSSLFFIEIPDHFNE